LREVSKNRTLAQCVSSKLDFELDTLQPTCGHLQAQAGLAVATVDGLSNDTLRGLRCLHTCGENENGKEEGTGECTVR